MALYYNRRKRKSALSIIIPCLNQVERIKATLQPLQDIRGKWGEIILADGGSCDQTLAQIRGLVDVVVQTPAGHAAQLNAGARRARGGYLLFLQADNVMSAEALQQIKAVVEKKDVLWGRFNIVIESPRAVFRLFERIINTYSCLTAVVGGGQGTFVRTDLFRALGGYTLQPVLEDVALSKSLRSVSRPHCLRGPLHIPAHQWEEHGLWSILYREGTLRLAYFWGVPVRRLARFYKAHR